MSATIRSITPSATRPSANCESDAAFNRNAVGPSLMAACTPSGGSMALASTTSSVVQPRDMSDAAMPAGAVGTTVPSGRR